MPEKTGKARRTAYVDFGNGRMMTLAAYDQIKAAPFNPVKDGDALKDGSDAIEGNAIGLGVAVGVLRAAARAVRELPAPGEGGEGGEGGAAVQGVAAESLATLLDALTAADVSAQQAREAILLLEQRVKRLLGRGMDR